MPHPHTTLIRVLLACFVVLAAIDGVLWYKVFVYNASTQAQQHLAGAVPVPIAVPGELPVAGQGIGVPVRIKIPSIALDAPIEKVALTKDGSMGVPKDPLDTGWYELGPRPGETGSATIAGHVDWWYGATAVLADLHKVKPGDTIAVQDDRGAVVSFVVRGTRVYGAGADAVDVFSSHDGKAHLNIITCDGAWDTNAKQYSERLVVFTDREL